MDIKFGEAAKGLSHSPLGIFALFIFLIYAVISLIITFASSFTPNERLPLIYFLIIFPVLVLIIFSWLVSKHYRNLFGPGHFKNEENFIELQKMQVKAAASLAVASTQNTNVNPDINAIVDTVQNIRHGTINYQSNWKNKLLWVDDIPTNNTYAKEAFEAIGFRVTLAINTKEALSLLSRNKYAAIISDMGRKEGPREGYVLLDKIRETDNETPFFIYAGSKSEEHKREIKQHGGQGTTNNANELFDMVTRAVIEQ